MNEQFNNDCLHSGQFLEGRHDVRHADKMEAYLLLLHAEIENATAQDWPLSCRFRKAQQMAKDFLAVHSVL